MATDGTAQVVERVRSYFLPPGEVPADQSLFRRVSIHGMAWAAKVPGLGGVIPSPPLPREGPTYFPRLGLIIGDVDPPSLERMQKDPEVANVLPGVVPTLIDGEAVELLEETSAKAPWSFDYLKISELWNKGLTGKGIAIGHLDSGVDNTHPSLAAAVRAFATVDSTGGFVEGPNGKDSHGHGTHTAGIICGRQQNETSVGMAPEATLYAADITGTGALKRLHGGLEWLLGKNIRILSLSAGVEPFNPVFGIIIDRLRASDILPIVAIGNLSAGTSYSPGNYRNTLGVGSINDQGAVANSSCSQEFNEPPAYAKPNVVAPGVNILSTRRNGGYELRSGTSQAAPCVVGVAALLMQARPQAGIGDIERAIIGTCRKLNGVPENRQGHGVIDPVAALQSL
jgi:subtilisin family serine protease